MGSDLGRIKVERYRAEGAGAAAWAFWCLSVLMGVFIGFVIRGWV